MNSLEIISEGTALLVLQLGIILIIVKSCAKIFEKYTLPPMTGQLLAGLFIGPYAAGGIALPGFPHGIFGTGAQAAAISTELYAIAVIGSVILLFSIGLETHIVLFLRYSIAGSLAGIGGVLVSFIAGNLAGMVLLNASFTSPQCLFLGVISTATSAQGFPVTAS